VSDACRCGHIVYEAVVARESLVYKPVETAVGCKPVIVAAKIVPTHLVNNNTYNEARLLSKL
jgi:hypothetical protein